LKAIKKITLHNLQLVYFHDSVAMMVFAFDFDLETGSISNRRLLIDRRTSFGEPDGMVVE
jgi:sugar lactone lactonase YvrE